MENNLSGYKMTTLIEQHNEFAKRWGVSNDIVNVEHEIQQFKNRIFNLFNSYTEYEANYPGLSYLTLYVKEKELFIRYPEANTYRGLNSILYLLQKADNFVEFLFILRFIINEIAHFYAQDRFNGTRHIFKFLNIQNSDLIKNLQECFEISNVNVKLMFDRSNHTNYFEIDFYPKGDKVLDKTLVDEVLPMLNEGSKYQYLQALKCYLNCEYLTSADHLRKTLESWLKETFNLKATLENIIKNIDSNLKAVLGQKIKEKYGKDFNKATVQINYISEFVDNVFPSFYELLKEYTRIHNDIIKHPSKVIPKLVEAELEFILYQTGAIIRFINNILNIEIIDEE